MIWFWGTVTFAAMATSKFVADWVNSVTASGVTLLLRMKSTSPRSDPSQIPPPVYAPFPTELLRVNCVVDVTVICHCPLALVFPRTPEISTKSPVISPWAGARRDLDRRGVRRSRDGQVGHARYGSVVRLPG